MSKFITVTSEFENLTKDWGFKCLKKLCYDNLVAFSKLIDELYYCYVIARVYKHDGSLETTLWVGPINRPDDGLYNLSANIKIQIGYDQTLDELFFKKCESKIINILQSGVLSSLLIASQKELSSPSFKNRRYKVYTKYILPLFKMIIQESKNNNKILENKKQLQSVMEKKFTLLEGEQKTFFETLGLKSSVDKIWELCYIYSLSK